MSFYGLANVVMSVWMEMKRRNTIGINMEERAFHDAVLSLYVIHQAEQTNPTAEAGPGIDKPKKGKK
jgi:hypothetical protein